jgi:hypothetical protein
MSTPLSHEALNQLFTKKLRHLSLQRFMDWCSDNDVRAEEVARANWTDSQGHAWSMVSRLGYLWLVGGKDGFQQPRNESLMSWLMHQAWMDLGVMTQPDEPDLAWAWLGLQRLGSPRVGTIKAMRTAFLRDCQWGDNGRGGWLNKALAMFERVQPQGPDFLAELPGRWWLSSDRVPYGPGLHVAGSWLEVDPNARRMIGPKVARELVDLGWRVAEARGEKGKEHEALTWSMSMAWDMAREELSDELFEEAGRRCVGHIERWAQDPEQAWRAVVAANGLLESGVGQLSDKEQTSLHQALVRAQDASHDQRASLNLKGSALVWFEARLLRSMGNSEVTAGSRARL